MKALIFTFLIILIILPLFGTAQHISVIDYVKILNDRKDEVLYYYQKNWQEYRKVALRKKYISSYEILKTKADTTADFDLILITQYADSTQHKLSEDRFNRIIKEIRPNGPVLLNGYKPAEFRRIQFSKNAVSFINPK